MGSSFINPIFDEPYGRQIEACGHIVSEEADVLRDLDAVHSAEMFAVIENGLDGVEYASVLGNGSVTASRHHLHIEIAAAAFFPKPPPVTTTTEGLNAAVAKFNGKQISTTVTARFAIESTELAGGSFVNAALATVELNKVIARQVFASFLVADGKSQIKLDVFRWKSEVRVTISFQVDTIVSPDYLKQMHDKSFLYFKSFILETGGESGSETERRSV